MRSTTVVVSSVVLKNNCVWLNGRSVFELPHASTEEFLSTAYEQLQISYPKFFKMDNLCKTAFIATEYLLPGGASTKLYKPEETALVISTANASLDTDVKYETSTKSNPSPSLFVYTLPNILIGELSIRHHFKGESACFVFDIFDTAFQTAYVDMLFDTGRTKRCISAWVDYYDNQAEAFFYLTELLSETQSPVHDVTTIKQLNILSLNE